MRRTIHIAFRAFGAGYWPVQHTPTYGTAILDRLPKRLIPQFQQFFELLSAEEDVIKEALLARRDRRINREGVVVIKAQRSRTQEANLTDARARLAALIAQAAQREKPRKPTKPTRGSVRRRLQAKTERGRTKALRQRPPSE